MASSKVAVALSDTVGSANYVPRISIGLLGATKYYEKCYKHKPQLMIVSATAAAGRRIRA